MEPFPQPQTRILQERDLMDVDDAMAIDHLMMLKMADAGADQTVAAAGAIQATDSWSRRAPPLTVQRRHTLPRCKATRISRR